MYVIYFFSPLGVQGTRYLDWEKYCSWFTTYETDEEYLKYFEEISKKIKVCIIRCSYEGLR